MNAMKIIKFKDLPSPTEGAETLHGESTLTTEGRYSDWHNAQSSVELRLFLKKKKTISNKT